MQALSCLSLVVLILASGVPIYAQRSEPVLEVREGDPLTVECGLRVEQRVEWRLSGAAPPPDMSPAGERAASGGGSGGLVARLRTESARPHHGGVYTCSGDGSGEEVRVRVLAARSARPARTDAEGGGAGVETSSAEPATERVAPSGPSVPLKLYMFNMGQPFTLNCTLKHIPEGIEYQWKKNGTVVEELSELKGRYSVEKSGTFQLTGRSTEDDFGNYTCGVRGAGDATGWQVHAHPHVKLPSDVNVVEGQKLKLQCRVYGKPYPAVEWRFRNASEANATDVREALGERVRLARSDQGVEGGELVLEAVRREDAGQYSCVAPAGADESVTVATDSTMLRVKDMYAALWPFLGICAEVFVLCAIILVYEKRRTKPEHDDSDTENHDQKKS